MSAQAPQAIAVAGTLGYLVGGVAGSGLPAGSFGYIYLPALAACVVASMLTAPLGAKAVRKKRAAEGKRMRKGGGDLESDSA